jgi:hypothetical protein
MGEATKNIYKLNAHKKNKIKYQIEELKKILDDVNCIYLSLLRLEKRDPAIWLPPPPPPPPPPAPWNPELTVETPLVEP